MPNPETCPKCGSEIPANAPAGMCPKCLLAGAAATEAVLAAIHVMEDSPLFNAGRGSVFNAEGKHEMDASIMEGDGLNAGAVASVSNVRNPIDLAMKVMTDSEHVMLSGEGAERIKLGTHYLRNYRFSLAATAAHQGDGKS